MSIIFSLFAREFTKNAIYIAILSIRIIVSPLFPTKKYQPTRLHRLVSKRMSQILWDLCALFFLFFAGHFREMPLGLLDHHAGQGEQGDQVGDGHEAVEGVGDGPG